MKVRLPGKTLAIITSTLVLSIATGFSLFAQMSLPERLDGEKPPSFHYMFPINPGTQNLLAGTMGELRSTHFHAGIDIRTNNMIGAAVRSAADGYVFRAIIGTGGYGKVLFVRHTNGQTTVYAHLILLRDSWDSMYARRNIPRSRLMSTSFLNLGSSPLKPVIPWLFPETPEVRRVLIFISRYATVPTKH